MKPIAWSILMILQYKANTVQGDVPETQALPFESASPSCVSMIALRVSDMRTM